MNQVDIYQLSGINVSFIVFNYYLSFRAYLIIPYHEDSKSSRTIERYDLIKRIDKRYIYREAKLKMKKEKILENTSLLSTSRKDILLPIYLSILPPRTQFFFRSFSSDRVLRLVQSLRFAELHATDPKANKGRGGRAKTRIRDHSYVLSKQELVADRPLRSQSRGLYEQRQLQQPPVATRSRAALVRRLPEQRWISYR